MTDTAALDRLLEHISAGVYGTPVRAMEEVLAIGAPAIPRLTDALASWRDDEGKGYAAMFAAVLLGEMRHPDALPALIEELKRPDLGAVTEVAADGLAKLGAAAVPPLIELARTGGERERLAAYLALGPMRDERVYALLMDALVRDGHLADVVALALADQGRAEAMPAIEAAYRRAEPWQRLEFESALLRLHDGIARGTGARSDWRLRYRRWDEDGEQFDRYGFGSLALVHADEALQQARPLLPLRPLEEILAEPEDAEEQTTCPDCGRTLQPYTGLRACPDTAVATAVLQLEVLEAAEDDDIEDIFELLDEIEEDERGRFSGLPPRGPRARQRWFEERDELRMCWDTCAWLVERGVGTVSEGISRLSDEARRLASRFGDPRRLLSPPAPVRLAGPKVGRNDPCPCGSGRKYKNCCLAKA